VLLNERDPDVGVAQFLERTKTAEPATEDDYMGNVSHKLREEFVRLVD